jgi:hypothetical protein
VTGAPIPQQLWAVPNSTVKLLALDNTISGTGGFNVVGYKRTGRGGAIAAEMLVLITDARSTGS